ncbi:hypothetical protein BJ138DRAFT_679834 [Hygrophoropsis aurantiaca]|uniref:Uncharacterized protein n=1 Tax=Hygrophoropsis aurantiaca TaxID=72124 RepID=A0ACB8AJL6_9AGAM|nr:hypothetical protein BJ138DRAFT_679834 [Hygrophoropsis aurantiaca]
MIPSTQTMSNRAMVCPSLAPSIRTHEGGEASSPSDIPYPDPSNQLLPHAPQPMARHPHFTPILTESTILNSTNHLDATGKFILRPSSAAPNDSQLLHPLDQRPRSPNRNTPPPQQVGGYWSPGTSLRPIASRASSYQTRAAFSSFSGMQSRSSLNSRASGRSTYRRHDGQTPRPLSNLRSSSTPTLANSYNVDQSNPPYPAGYTAPPSASDPHHPGDPVDLLEDLRFAPMSTHGVRRYDRSQITNTVINPDKKDHLIEALTLRYPSSDEKVPEGWSLHIHPEGAQYFLCEHTRTYTEVDICDLDIFYDIQRFAYTLHESLHLFIEEKHLDLNLDEVELVLEPTEDEFGTLCCYYFVNHRERCFFWLQDYDAEAVLDDCKGVTSLSHKKFAIEAQYWKHWDYFPNLCLLTQSVVDELRDMMLHANCDHLTSKRSSAPFSVDELKNHISVVDAIKVDSNLADRRHSSCVIGRIMYTFYRNKYLNFHGQKGARLHFDQTVHGWAYTQSKIMMIVNPLLFYAPSAHLRSLHNIFVDEIASATTWNAFTTKLNKELQDFNLLATVLLNANVGFLAIQSVDNGGGISLRQIASYLSLVASMASIIAGLIFVRHNRTSGRDTAYEAAKFLDSMHNQKHGLEALAILYSLPYALLMWGMLFFAVAFCIECFKPGDTFSRVLVGLMVFTACALIGWCSYVATDGGDFFWKSQKDKLSPATDHELIPPLPRSISQLSFPPRDIDSDTASINIEVHTVTDAGSLRNEESSNCRVPQAAV